MRVAKMKFCGLGVLALVTLMAAACGVGREKTRRATPTALNVTPGENSLGSHYDLAVVGMHSGEVSPVATETCTRTPDGSVLIERKSASSRTELWRAGAWFGRNDGAKPNVGFRGAGNSATGAPTTSQPQSLGCRQQGGLVLGWQFSNNVAGLVNLMQLDTVIVREPTLLGSAGARTEIRVSGQRTETYLDPAEVWPYTATPQLPYFDESTSAGSGQMVISRLVQIGGVTANKVRIERNSGTGQNRPRIFETQVRTLPGEPLHERVTRQLDNRWTLKERLLVSGAFRAEFADGVVAVSRVENILFRKNLETGHTCVPLQGQLVHEFKLGTSAASPVIQVTQKYRLDSAGKSQADSQILCPKVANPQRCAALSQQAMLLYAPPACLY